MKLDKHVRKFIKEHIEEGTWLDVRTTLWDKSIEGSEATPDLVGEKVVLVAFDSFETVNDYDPRLEYYFDKNCVGEVMSVDSDGEIYVDWGVSINSSYRHYDSRLVRYKDLLVAAKPLGEFNEEELDKVVLKNDARKEIVSVLKQHDKSQLIFEHWGLGEVIDYGKGMTFLFYGPPGTGKTWGANCIAKALGTELITIGAAEIQTSEPGGANRNIVKAFKQAKSEKKVLFLDECDSLITTRQNVGMVLGSEINTLLTEIEKFEGVLILATNRVETLDPALERRISLIVEFEEPDFAMRKDIWSKLLPEKMPLAENVKVDVLAEYKLTGGQIKNVVLNAARMAASEEAKAVGKDHFDVAVTRLNNSKSLLGTASSYIQVLEKASKVKA